MTDRYAVIGNPVAHSKSPWIHRRFAQQTGQDIAYEPRLAPLDGFPETIAALRAEGLCGANVTLPFKEPARHLSTEVSARARAADAVNTLVFRGPETYGDNTDGCGLVRDLSANLGFVVAGCRVLLLGAGGAARGVVLPLLEQKPASLVIANRDVEKARALACRFEGVAWSGFADLAGRRFDLIVNATSTGLTGVRLPLPAGLFAPGSLAYEMVYGQETAFMQQAKSEGAALVADGLGMLVEQAAESFFLWRGVRPETGPVLAGLRAA